MDEINPNYLLIGVLAIAGVIALLSGLVTLASSLRSRRWPHVAGVVTRSTAVSVRRKQNRSPMWAPEVHYQYTVNNTKMTGTLIRFGMEGLQAGREFAATYIELYPVGKAVQVFYDPNRAENSVLEPGVSMKCIWPIAIGVALLTLGFWFAASYWNQIPA